jgi:hypothetical protein
MRQAKLFFSSDQQRTNLSSTTVRSSTARRQSPHYPIFVVPNFRRELVETRETCRQPQVKPLDAYVGERSARAADINSKSQ